MIGPRRHAVEQLLDLYEANQLLPNGIDLPLHQVCPNRPSCWDSGAECQPRQLHRSGIAVPWIGSRYTETRICVVGINLNGWGGLDAHWYICRGYADDLRAGRRGKAGKPFAHGAACYVHAVLTHLEGSPPAREIPPPPRVADAWDGCAFVEAIKCSPDRSSATPLDPMWANCPRLLLLDELEILQPRVILALGRGPLRDHLRPLLRKDRLLEWGTHPGHIERDRLQLSTTSSECFSLNHPSFPAWKKSYRQLIESLDTEPLP